jgi:hypothetical protein
MTQQTQFTKAEIDAMNFEMDTTFDTTLTEERYNQLLDALLPTLEGFPDAQATLKAFGDLAWRKRRAERNQRKTAA